MKGTIFLITICLLISLQSCNNKKTELILLGTVHNPVENFNPEILYTILVKIKPDLILFEVDSSFFTKNFKFNKTWNSNENISTIKYMSNHKVDVRPYDFTGRNEYRIKIGARPTDTKVLQLLDSLYRNNFLNSIDKKIYADFLIINDSLNAISLLKPQVFNNSKTDSIAQVRQLFMYDKFLKIINNNSIFNNTYSIKKDRDSISYSDGYKRAAEFWELRNKTMAKNILHFVNEYKGKKIVVLNGFFHRYYLHSILKPKQASNDFIIKEFYQY